MEIRVGPPTVTIHADDQFCVCAANSEMSSTLEQGYFAADTRLVSGYRLKLGRSRPVLINSAAVAHRSARFEFTNPTIAEATGAKLSEKCLHLRLDRTIGSGIHEDYELTSYAPYEVVIDLEVSIESDFADLFDVKSHQPLLRGSLHSSWDEAAARLGVSYRDEDFERGLIIEAAKASSPVRYVNGGLLFRIVLQPRDCWHTCLLWRPVINGTAGDPPSMCHDLASHADDQLVV